MHSWEELAFKDLFLDGTFQNPSKNIKQPLTRYDEFRWEFHLYLHFIV